MNIKLQGIALILFGILLNLSAVPIYDIFFSDLSYIDYILTVIAILSGIAGMIMVFIDFEKLRQGKKK